MSYPTDQDFEDARRHRTPPAQQQQAPTFDLVTFIERQRAFSLRTFGPGSRTEGIVDHIRKELVEVLEDRSIAEWVDVILLAIDGAWRSGASPKKIAAALLEKLERNEIRTWPDWREMSQDRAIEHVRESGDRQ